MSYRVVTWYKDDGPFASAMEFRHLELAHAFAVEECKWEKTKYCMIYDVSNLLIPIHLKQVDGDFWDGV